MDQSFQGDWPTLFGVPSDRLRSVFLGDPRQPESGLVELVCFEGLDPAGAGSKVGRTPSAGFFLLSFYVDVTQTVARLKSVGTIPDASIEVKGLSGPVRMATVLDPDGVLVELIDRG
jgi:glyoxylase I family protein